MAFKDNLRKKIEINTLVNRINASMGPPESGRRVDKDLVRKLLAEGDYEKILERDMEIYRLPPVDDRPRLLVLDNDLPVYCTPIEDVVLRKSPIVKEMPNIRNVIKILNDADVVVSKKEASLEMLRDELIAELDLSFTAEDIEDLVYDGRSALENRYIEGIEETLALFAELLAYAAVPKVLQVNHHTIWGAPGGTSGQRQYGPIVLFDRMHNSLKLIQETIALSDPEALDHYQSLVTGDAKPDEAGGEVFKTLGRFVIEGQAQGDGAN